MRLTVIGHSALFVETRGPTLLVDPWLFGSAGWRSWWHFPPSSQVREAWLSPDYVYLTHHHPDHFHYPSMRRISRDARILIPRFGVDVMEGELRGLGFRHVRELPHGEVVELAPGVCVASYQYGFDDTLFAVADGDDSIVDINDCKIRGLPMRQVLRDFGSPSVALKSHSFAQAYPHCYEAEDPADLELVARETYLEDFAHAMRELSPRYAIPFGSMVAFLHPESLAVNQHLVTPAEVVAYCARSGALPATDVVPMAPGDRWDSTRGFERSDFDWYAERERHLAELAEAVRPKVERALAREAGRSVPFEAFEAYFGRFVRAIPRAAAHVFLRRPVVFEVPSSEAPFFALDFRRRRVLRTRQPPEDRASLLRVPEGVLADAMEKGIVHFVHGSMRIHVRVRRGGIHGDLAFWGFLMIWEIGYLPLRRVATRRFLSVLWRRRREAAETLRALFGRGTPLARLSSRFAAPRSAPGSGDAA